MYGVRFRADLEQVRTKLAAGADPDPATGPLHRLRLAGSRAFTGEPDVWIELPDIDWWAHDA